MVNNFTNIKQSEQPPFILNNWAQEKPWHIALEIQVVTQLDRQYILFY